MQVVISRNRAKGQLVVDGKLKNVKLRNPSKIFMPITTPFYVGGIPKEVKLNRLPDMVGGFVILGEACLMLLLVLGWCRCFSGMCS